MHDPQQVGGGLPLYLLFLLLTHHTFASLQLSLVRQTTQATPRANPPVFSPIWVALTAAEWVIRMVEEEGVIVAKELILIVVQMLATI